MSNAAPLAVVTGLSSGIGCAVAGRLIAQGWSVIGVDIDGPPEGMPLAAMIRADLSTSAGLRAAAQALAGRRARGFVHAAGIMRADTDAATRADAGAGLWTLHVGAAQALAEALAPGMPEGQGRMVFLSSRAAQGRAGRGLYAASKAALDGLARSLAAAHVARGITVNIVAPAATDTPQLRDPGRADAPVRPLPIGRVIRPEEVAATVAFLLSDEAGAITGQTIYQCGGASLAGVEAAAAQPGVGG